MEKPHMNRSDKPAPSERINPSGTERDRTRNTPSADMQAEDTGTAASGTETGQEASPEPAMKQTSKTESERNPPR
jgi:hypothetical protein